MLGGEAQVWVLASRLHGQNSAGLESQAVAQGSLQLVGRSLAPENEVRVHGVSETDACLLS